jgi:nitrogen regulatory protein PII
MHAFPGGVNYKSAMCRRSLPKVKFEIVIADCRVPEALQAIIKAARTGKVGDGKAFVVAIEETIRIRTRERGSAAV